MTPTPEQLAAAEKIDVTRYEGHTPWPWHFNTASGALTQTQHITRDVWFLPRVEQDIPLLEDAPLIPALIHQRDEARIERDIARAGHATAERQRNEARYERDAARESADLYREAAELYRDHGTHEGGTRHLVRDNANALISKADAIRKGASDAD